MSVPNHFDIVQEFAQKYGTPDNLNEDSRRAWTGKVAQTLKAKYPAEGWGTKRASPTRPISADVVCTQSPFEGADLLTGDGKEGSHISIIKWGDTGSLDGQVFVPVEAFDWLAAESTPETPGSTETEETTEAVAALSQRLSALAATVEALAASVATLTTRVNSLAEVQPVSWLCEDVAISTSRTWGHAHTVKVPTVRRATDEGE